MKPSAQVAERLDRLAVRYGLGPGVRQGLERLLVALAAPDAPTTVRDPRVGVDVHLADALVALELPEIRRATVVADVGAGAGVPGLPLALALPAARVVLLESQARKCAFLRAAAEASGVRNTEVVCSRVENWAAGGGAQAIGVVTVRAVAALAVLCEYAAPLLRRDGVLVAWKGEVDPDELADGRAAASVVGLETEAVRAVTPYPGSERRTLHVYRKTGDTPERFPRRAGMASKRPLGVARR